MTRSCQRPSVVVTVLAAILHAAMPAGAQDGPNVDVTAEPEGTVVVGSPVRVTATVIVPTYMPSPPEWPDLEIADAITRRSQRATHPVSERVGGETWSGVARTWEIIPQRPADYEIGDASVTVTFADPRANSPTETTVPLPAIRFEATVPKGAEGMDPFLAAAKLSVQVRQDGPPDPPRPGDSLTLTVTTTAVGPPAMLLPSLADRLPAPPGLRSYVGTPEIADGAGDAPAATRTETITYVIERPGTYRLPAIEVDWWNTDEEASETASAKAIEIVVGAQPASAGDSRARIPPATGWVLALVAILLVAGAWAVIARRRDTGSEAALYRKLRRAARREPVSSIRPALQAWWSAGRGHPDASILREVENAVRSLERGVYGPAGQNPADAPARTQLLALLTKVRRLEIQRSEPIRLPLNPMR